MVLLGCSLSIKRERIKKNVIKILYGLIIGLIFTGLMFYFVFFRLNGDDDSYKDKKRKNLETKLCISCRRPFFWRKKWSNNWQNVKYCSKKCSSFKIS